MSPVEELRVSHRAQVRAAASSIVDAPRRRSPFVFPQGTALHGSERRRSTARAARGRPVPEPAHMRRRLRRLLIGAVLAVQVAMLVSLFTLPVFRVRTVHVSGLQRVTSGTVLEAAAVPRGSVFAIDGSAIAARVRALPWVRSVTVTTQLPAAVTIAVTEWQPEVLVRHRGTATLVAAGGATLPLEPAAPAPAAVPVVLDDRAGGAPLPPGLAAVIGAAQARWHDLFGCRLLGFSLSNANVLSAWCDSGWGAVFGELDGGAAVAGVPHQLAVLAALRGRLDFTRPAFGYVHLENPAAPAVGGGAGVPSWVTAELAGRGAAPATPQLKAALPAARGAAAASPPAAAARPAAPTPVVFSQPSPSPPA